VRERDRPLPDRLPARPARLRLGLSDVPQRADEVAADVPAAAFREYGTKLADEPYAEGLSATALLTLTVVAEGSPYRAVGQAITIDAGTEFLIDNASFALEDDVVVPAGSTVAPGVAATATDTGVAFNDLPGDTVSPMIASRELAAVSLDAPTSGGQDEESDAEYEDRLSRVLQLQAKTLVTLRDFELWALVRYPDSVGRAVARHLGARHVEVTLTDPIGETVPAPLKTDLADEYAQYRLANTTIDIVDATYTTVNVTYSVKLYPAADPTDAIARIDAALAAELSPDSWGSPKYTRDRPQPTWYNDPVVRKNKLIDLIGDVEGVDYVNDLTLSVPGGTPAPDAGGNLTMPGAVALPRPGTMTGTTV
jgi:hypothetical protein